MSAAGPQRPERMPEDMPDRTPDRMSDRMPEDMPDKMPEDMPDRMPEDGTNKKGSRSHIARIIVSNFHNQVGRLDAVHYIASIGRLRPPLAEPVQTVASITMDPRVPSLTEAATAEFGQSF